MFIVEFVERTVVLVEKLIAFVCYERSLTIIPRFLIRVILLYEPLTLLLPLNIILKYLPRLLSRQPLLHILILPLRKIIQLRRHLLRLNIPIRFLLSAMDRLMRYLVILVNQRISRPVKSSVLRFVHVDQLGILDRF